jgi:hypothetical protein
VPTDLALFDFFSGLVTIIPRKWLPTAQSFKSLTRAEAVQMELRYLVVWAWNFVSDQTSQVQGFIVKRQIIRL